MTWAAMLLAMSSSNVRRLSAAEVQPLLKSPGFTVVDVREPYEYPVGHLAGSLHIPLGELEERLGEIPAATTPIFICRSGGRSLAACQLAVHAGAAEAVNLEGGLQAWAAEIDSGVEVA